MTHVGFFTSQLLEESNSVDSGFFYCVISTILMLWFHLRFQPAVSLASPLSWLLFAILSVFSLVHGANPGSWCCLLFVVLLASFDQLSGVYPSDVWIHRIIQAGPHLWRSYSATFYSDQDLLEQVAQGHDQLGFEDL